jgi:cell wall-associated NlpC family hydrolase
MARVHTAAFWCLIVALALTAACACRDAVPRPFPGAPAPAEPRPAPAVTDPAAADESAAAADADASIASPAAMPAMERLLDMALGFRGVPYRNGGTDPSGFDCSGLVQYVFARHGVPLPREVRDQFRAGTAVSRERVQPGDLLFFETVSRGASHVGIAIGGGEFVHAPSSRGVVRVERLSTDYWAERWVGARRVTL